MRQLSPKTNLLLAFLSAFGLVSALGLPWYAPAQIPADPSGFRHGDGPMEQFADQLARTFTSYGSTLTGSHALGASKTLLMLIAFAVAMLSMAMVVPALRTSLRDVLRAVAVVGPILVLYLAYDTPGSSSSLEIRWGLLVGVAAATFMATCAWHGSSVRVKRHVQPLSRPARATD